MTGFRRLSKTPVFPIVCVIINLVVAIIIAVLFYKMKTQTKETDAGFCLKCEELELPNQTVLMNKLTRHQDGETYNCCASDSEQLEAMIDLRILKQKQRQAQREQIDTENDKQIAASAHNVLGYRRLFVNFRGVDLPIFNAGPRSDLIFVDQKKFEIVEHAQGVEVTESGYRIQHSGRYFVYSGLDFMYINNKRCGDAPSSIWRHTVLRIRPQQETITLLEAIHTCDDDLTKNSHTTYAAGQFELEAGDVIKAEISGYAILEYTHESNFLGLFLTELTKQRSSE